MIFWWDLHLHAWVEFWLVFLLSFYFAAQSSGQCRQHLDLSKQTSLKAESYYPTYYGFYKEGRADVNAGQSECSHTTPCLQNGFGRAKHKAGVERETRATEKWRSSAPFPSRVSRDSRSLRACLRSFVLTSTESTWGATPCERSRASFCFLHVLDRGAEYAKTEQAEERFWRP